MSTAKSMATLYLNGKRNCTNNNKSGTPTHSNTNQRFKSSTSNLAQSHIRQPSNCCSDQATTKSRLKSTSMTNLVAGGDQQAGGDGQEHQQQPPASRMQRPASRNALDSIHNGMNAKYAQVQSKVYLQNIKPAGSSSKIPGSKTLAQQLDNAAAAAAAAAAGIKQQVSAPSGTKLKAAPKMAAAVASERSLLIAKLKALEDELASQETDRDNLREKIDEVEREKSEAAEQVQQLKQELQDKLAEHDRQNEEYHKKLLEAYELADQNRRAADSVLAESRQRDEESRKRVEQLESQLNELKEFVSVKEEVMGKMSELREQLRQERERYEEQLKSLHQVFENEKISHEAEIQLANQAVLLAERSASKHLVDENSNYFNRTKPNLESSESINKQPYASTGCRHCQSGSSQLHRSEQDIYGSKMSTRMQDTAKSAWKASRKFASSVITGGVNLSACRQCTKRTGTSSPPAPQQPSAKLVTNGAGAEFASTLASAKPAQLGAGTAEQPDEVNAGRQHTSVIQVGPASLSEASAECSPARRRRQARAATDQPSMVVVEHEQPPSSHLIKVDENNKLTIVTKFNDSECQTNGGEMMGASSSVSERSRCESSSSGRGTSSSDAGSAASQNGDDEAATNPKGGLDCPKVVAAAAAAEQQKPAKGHRRRSSLFKASKVFGGSQVSLNKIKSLFVGGSKGVSATGKHTTELAKQPQVSLDHLEASRLRCMELNQATTMTPIVATTTDLSPRTNNNNNNEQALKTISGEVTTTSPSSSSHREIGQDAMGLALQQQDSADEGATSATTKCHDYPTSGGHTERPPLEQAAVVRIASSVS